MKLSRKKWTYGCVIGCVVLMVVLVSLFDTKFKDITISESLVREKVQETLPIVKVDTIAGLYVVEVNLTAIDIKFEQDKINLTATGSVSLAHTSFFQEGKALIKNMFKKKSESEPVKKKGPKRIDFTLFFSGLPDYDNRENSIYLTIHDLEVTELKLENLDVFVDSKGIVAGAIVKVAKLYLDRYPLYKLSNDFKGATVRAAVKGLEFQSEELIIHFSLWGLIGGMIWWFICALVGFLAMIILMIVVALNPKLLVEMVKEI